MLFWTIIFVLACLLFSFGKILLEEFILESSTLHWVEWIVASAMPVGYYFYLASVPISPGWCLLYAMGLGLWVFLVSLGLPALLRTTIGWADEDEPLENFFPVLMLVFLFLMFLPTGMAKILGFPEIFEGRLYLFFVAIGAEAVVLFLHFWLCSNIALSLWSHWSVNTILVVAIMAIAMNSVPARTHAWIIATILAIVIHIEMTTAFFLGHFSWQLFELPPGFFKGQAIVFLVQMLALFLMYIFPVFSRFVS